MHPRFWEPAFSYPVKYFCTTSALRFRVRSSTYPVTDDQPKQCYFIVLSSIYLQGDRGSPELSLAFLKKISYHLSSSDICSTAPFSKLFRRSQRDE